jgi:DivIVA domain-containing protein
VELDRQAIEKRDFPISRRGYDTAAVDAHLRALAAEIEELQRARIGSGGEPSLASTAGTQVQSILEAAETAAADIERQALQSASSVREEADRDAEQTREVAVKRAQAHVGAVAQATSTLLQRVESMDGEVTALVESLRAGASRLAADLVAVETNMGELYDAASRSASTAVDGEPSPATVHAEVGDATAEMPAEQSPTTPAPAAAPAPAVAPSQSSVQSALPVAPTAQAAAETPTTENSDLDGARLIALNMALNGESREATDLYLAENYQLADRQQLIEEVYAAIEG